MWFNTISICLLQLGTALSLAGSVSALDSGLVTGDTARVRGASWTRGPDGKYVHVSDGPGIEIRTSTDRTNWQIVGDAVPIGWPAPSSAFTLAANGGLRNPDISYHNGTFYLYYTAYNPDGRTSAIFLATSNTGKPLDWVDEGVVLSPQNRKATTLEIPSVNLAVTDDNTWHLVVGGWEDGVMVYSIDPVTHKPDTQPGVEVARKELVKSIDPVLYHWGDHWYLFTLWGGCVEAPPCRLDELYTIAVARGPSPAGPFVDQDGVAALEGGGTLVVGPLVAGQGPTSPSILRDVEQSVLAYSWYDGRRESYGLRINLLGFAPTGWPTAY